jgi:quercetin dioxygenase-like cupin family protein
VSPEGAEADAAASISTRSANTSRATTCGPEHRLAETASIHAVTGRVRLRLPDRVADLSTGRLLVLEPGLPHDVEALEESTLLLTLGWRRT